MCIFAVLQSMAAGENHTDRPEILSSNPRDAGWYDLLRSRPRTVLLGLLIGEAVGIEALSFAFHELLPFLVQREASWLLRFLLGIAVGMPLSVVFLLTERQRLIRKARKVKASL
ncbi:MAG: hypothetical protein AUJ92_16420 [Armatimonadetes bacterium CG2_30_59_28]|nr:MAG: hypothetical protein AUJ92_16420 [Armatimonadetes bacterium CG2_30_59_28]PIU65943.1 MAG: hypothetical protein COS85_06605 [Armatimonadetes bacterium CG07_land_8_20_14_0_80_59_28]PIX40832.1 MAG: hypothetical protein COZ56_13650 [Armatimonadetes bacterium CG_4_8_14_3_um_filter_58_9]PIY43312.1 MAG: hypothetical protein COZ05_11435 [Armatimonadetes bacterium CG_4_10_14_3_um_filter_59_10]PJB61672.1 MAG: hypothetical protein CO095_20130 [Armatimonadetes bacterium CG_4_9_14_3_um_filter_58_7]